MASAVNGDMNQKAITELREYINVQLKMKNHSLKHQIILIGDSNMRGYACSLPTLLDREYNVYSVVKPGSSSKELLHTTKESIKHLTQNDMVVLCYGTND